MSCGLTTCQVCHKGLVDHVSKCCDMHLDVWSVDKARAGGGC